MWPLILILVAFRTGEDLPRPEIDGITVEHYAPVTLIVGTDGVLIPGALGGISAIPVVAHVGEANRILVA